jgi:hypothetical protein
MIVFATSDKGGTGRSVTSCNVVYRRALQGSDVCYLDFDFGSPTAGAIFNVNAVMRGTTSGGLHSYLRNRDHGREPHKVDVWSESDLHGGRRDRPSGAGRLVLMPGDIGGGEFPYEPDIVARCVNLFLRVEEEFDLCVVDLSAGRSHATEIVLEATADRRMRSVPARWLVFHRWTRQHIIAAEGLAFGAGGIVGTGTRKGHDEQRLRNAIRFIRTAVVDPWSSQVGHLSHEQVAWLRHCNKDLQRLAGERGVGETATLGSVPLDPLLQWREQLISDADTLNLRIANEATVIAFETIAKKLTDEAAWTPW